MSSREQTHPEEIANTLTHGLGIIFCLIAIPYLFIESGKHLSTAQVWSLLVFGFGMLMVYSSSTLYHAARNKQIKHLLRIWDHISIFLLIAGSYTPFVIRYTDEVTATTFLSIMWVIVAAGSVLKLFYTGQFKALSLLLYIALGCMAVFIIKPLQQNLPESVLWWLLAGGGFYLFGVIFYVWKRLYFHHAIWHCFVLAGTVTHYIAIYKSASHEAL